MREELPLYKCDMFSMFNDWGGGEVSVDIGGIVDHHYLKIICIMYTCGLTKYT
jgi:hypothetical protein